LTQTDEISEVVKAGETVEIISIHAVFTQVGENMAGCRKWLGEYPTLSATFLKVLPNTDVP
jgi:hypothetical protein